MAKKSITSPYPLLVKYSLAFPHGGKYNIFHVEGCRDGSAKNHTNKVCGWQCAGNTGHRKTTQATPSLHP